MQDALWARQVRGPMHYAARCEFDGYESSSQGRAPRSFKVASFARVSTQ